MLGYFLKYFSHPLPSLTGPSLRRLAPSYGTSKTQRNGESPKLVLYSQVGSKKSLIWDSRLVLKATKVQNKKRLSLDRDSTSLFGGIYIYILDN